MLVRHTNVPFRPTVLVQCSCSFHQYSTTSSTWSHKQEIHRIYALNRNWAFPGKHLIHTKRQSYLSFGMGIQQLCLLLPRKILPTTTRSCSGFPCISSYCQHLNGIHWRTSSRPWMFHTYPWGKRYVHDIISIVIKEQVDTLLNHLNFVDPHISFTVEAPGSGGFRKVFPVQTIPYIPLIYRKPAHTGHYLDWSSLTTQFQPT